MDACSAMCPVFHTVNMVRNMVLVMDVATVNQLTMDANLAELVCCMDDIGCQTMGSTVALDTCAAIADVLVVNRLWPDSTVIQASKLYAYEDVVTVHRSW